MPVIKISLIQEWYSKVDKIDLLLLALMYMTNDLHIFKENGFQIDKDLMVNNEFEI